MQYACSGLIMPAKMVFGWGCRTQLGSLAATLGTRVWLVTGSQTLSAGGLLQEMTASLQASGLQVSLVTAPSREPEVADVDELAQRWVSAGALPGDCVVAVGGGSTLDLAKAAAAMVTNRHGTSVRDFLEGVGTGAVLKAAPLPMLAVPTTAGTGSEATKNAVISSYDPLFKKSLRADAMLPRAVLIDPELTVSVPPQTTAYTGMDAITQLLESYLSRRTNPLVQALCVQGLISAVPSIQTAVSEGTNRAAREGMSHAAFLSGIALANSGLGLAHGVAAALGVHARVPHGLACAVMLVPALQFNARCREEELARLNRLLFLRVEPSPRRAAEQLIAEIARLCDAIHIPKRLRDLGVRKDQIPELVPASQGNSLSGNPRDVSPAELQTLLESMW